MEIVNGYICRDCTDVGYAKRFIDPAHPKDGPNGRDAPDKASAERGPAVTFGGALASARDAGAPSGVEPVNPAAYATGAAVDLKA